MSGPDARMPLTPLIGTSLALHAAALPTAAIAPERWPWIVGALVADHLVILGGGLAPRSALLGPNVVRSEAAAASGGVVLTFDDGPDPAVTPRVLDQLDAHRASATFFCIGERVARCPELAQELVHRGHRVENHTHSHRALFFFHRPSSLDREIAACQEAVAQACGRVPSYFRAPAGIRSPLLQGALRRSGLKLVSWTRRGFDTVARDPAHVAARLTRGMRAGDVIVLHDGSSHSRSTARPMVTEALPRVLDAIAAAGLRAVALGAGA